MSSGVLNTHEVDGRGMNSVYALPVDKAEQDRLDMQHAMWKQFLGGNGLYPIEADGLIRQLLERKSSDSTPMIMDVGSGSGIWAVQMAELFPQAAVLGLDLTESKPNHIPPNCRFVAKDVLTGLDEYKEKFDLIYARCVIGHMTDVFAFIRMMCDCLKPGGVLFVADGNPGVYDAKEKELEPASLDVAADNSNKSWMALMMLHYLKVMESRVGPREIIGQTLDDLVPKEPRLQAIGRKTFFDLLNCPEGSTDLSKSRGLAFAKSVKPAVMGAGMDPEVAERIIQNISLEFIGPMKTFGRWDLIWATKEV